MAKRKMKPCCVYCGVTEWADREIKRLWSGPAGHEPQRMEALLRLYESGCKRVSECPCKGKGLKATGRLEVVS